MDVLLKIASYAVLKSQEYWGHGGESEPKATRQNLLQFSGKHGEKERITVRHLQ